MTKSKRSTTPLRQIRDHRTLENVHGGIVKDATGLGFTTKPGIKEGWTDVDVLRQETVYDS